MIDNVYRRDNDEQGGREVMRWTKEKIVGT